MNEKIAGTNAEPTADELEFIYNAFTRNLRDGEVLAEIQDRPFPQRSLRFISRRRKEFDAAKKVLENHIKTENDPQVVEAKGKHINDLVGIAETLINGLEGVEFKGEDNYEISQGVSLSRKQVVNNLIDNVGKARQKYRDYNRFYNFLIHFNAKAPNNEGIETYAERHPIALINLLRLIILKKDFGIGICPVCKDW
jgi:hypothetical protein